ncbi:MAG: hypothetical protein ABSE07_01720 [Methanoregula sp.]|jgi:hypothetical protein
MPQIIAMGIPCFVIKNAVQMTGKRKSTGKRKIRDPEAVDDRENTKVEIRVHEVISKVTMKKW